MVPFYDDVSYLNDGLTRLNAFDMQGFAGLARSFLDDAPHAPYSSLLATIGFALTPKSMLGAYALNAIWVIVFLLLVRYLVQGLPRLSQVGVMVASLAIPMLATVVGSFRPDTYWGLITGQVAIILANMDFAKATGRQMILTGVLVGATALSKPTGLPAGCVVMGIGYLGAVVVSLAVGSVPLKQIATRTSLMLVGAAILVVPYLIVGGRDLLHYILAVMSDNVSVWRTEGSFSTHLVYYLKPNLAASCVGWMLYVGPFFLLLWLVTAGRSRNRGVFVRTLAVWASLFTAYAIPTVSPVKSDFIGSLFYGTFIAGALWSLAQLLRAKPVPGVVVLAAGTAIFLVSWRPSVPMVKHDSSYYAAIDKANRAVTPAILEVLADGSAQGEILSVYTASPGPVLDATLRYEALLRGIPSTFWGDYTSRNWSSILAKAQMADVVVATNAGALGQGGNFSYPGIQYQDRLIAELATDRSWRTLTIYIDDAGYKTIVFTKRPPPSPIKLFFGDGFRDQEGPLPDQGLPTFRWMLGDSATLIVRNTAVAAPTGTFGLRCQSIADVNLSILDAAGRQLTSTELRARAGSGRFDVIDVPLDPQSNSATVLSLRLKAPNVPLGPWPGYVLCATITSVHPPYSNVR